MAYFFIFNPFLISILKITGLKKNLQHIAPLVAQSPLARPKHSIAPPHVARQGLPPWHAGYRCSRGHMRVPPCRASGIGATSRFRAWPIFLFSFFLSPLSFLLHAPPRRQWPAAAPPLALRRPSSARAGPAPLRCPSSARAAPPPLPHRCAAGQEEEARRPLLDLLGPVGAAG